MMVKFIFLVTHITARYGRLRHNQGEPFRPQFLLYEKRVRGVI